MNLWYIFLRIKDNCHKSMQNVGKAGRMTQEFCTFIIRKLVNERYITLHCNKESSGTLPNQSRLVQNGPIIGVTTCKD